MVGLSECLSYRGFELSSDFYEKVLVKVQREFKSSSSYWKFELSGFELSGVYCIFWGFQDFLTYLASIFWSLLNLPNSIFQGLFHKSNVNKTLFHLFLFNPEILCRVLSSTCLILNIFKIILIITAKSICSHCTV